MGAKAEQNNQQLVLGLALFLWLLLLSGALAQNCTLDWSTVDGRGGTDTLSGGFWGAIAAVQTEGAPYLTVTRSNNSVVVSWPVPATGWLLHSTTNLVTGGSVWTAIPPSSYQTNGGNLQFTEPLPVGNKFYRLHKP